MNSIEDFMDIAINEAKTSLKEGNSGFGAVIIKDNAIISKAHDTDKTSNDPTAHAEITAIKQAASINKKDFSGCTLVSTHEPCPMCSTAIVWSGIKKIAFGYSIQESIQQGRKRISLSCEELFQRSGVSIEVQSDIKKVECALFYNSQIRKSIKQLRNIDFIELERLAENLTKKRIDWFSKQKISPESNDCLDSAYHLFLKKLDITDDEAPIVKRKSDRITIHSRNFCPTLEAYKILDLDTRVICKKLNENPTQVLLQQMNPRLRFERNYNKLRPYTPYCEEMIILDNT
jgi:tRNA(adenine34) deaminase